MEPKENNKEKLYFHIGKLFYGIAMADRKIDRKEIIALKNTVSKNWMHESLTPDHFNTDGPQEILEAFSEMQHTKADSDPCFSAFRDFYLENQRLFTQDVKKRIWETAQTLALSMAKKNKSELIVLAKLRLLFQT
ncbi:MAG: hypothetical protein WBM98_02465 [Maribacter sp.]|uniref:hypothetical protein n=1 Tax=Maribacter sp. TaxID=1897614 RepID=UPI003C7488B2